MAPDLCERQGQGMAFAEQFGPVDDDLHPIDIVEALAAHRRWEYERLDDDQILLTIDGQWRTYTLTLAWSSREAVLRLVCTFDFDPPAARLGDLYEALNLANDEVWDGGFTWWAAQKLMVWRYGLVLVGAEMAGPGQVDHMINAAVTEAERFYPAFQLACWGSTTPAAALDIAMSDAYGRA